MSLLDGTYEVLRELERDGERTVMDATGPTGNPVRIVWFDLAPDREAAFEAYRRTLKRLQRSGLTTMHEVTSRPGAHYAVWEPIPDDASATRDRAVDRVLDELGLERGAVDVRRIDGEARIVDVAFGDGQSFAIAGPGAETPAGADAAAAGASPGTSGAEPPHGPMAWLTRVGDAFLRAPAWPVALILLGAATLIAFGAVDRYLEDRIVAVPDVVGVPVTKAIDELRALELGVRATSRPAAASPGTVLSIEPGPGTSIRPRRTVDLEYAAPAEAVAAVDVPDVRREADLASAEAALLEAGLQLGTLERVAAPDALGAILAQRPGPDAEVQTGTAVDLLVSLGPRGARTFVPDLIGLRLEDARVLARIAGLPSERVAVAGPAPRAEEAPPPDDASIVVAQSPQAFVPFALEGAVLRLIVEPADAPLESAAVPSVVGLDVASARALLAPLGRPFEVTEISTRDLPDGVVDQDPPPGPRPNGADPVRLTVNTRPVDVPTPDVTVRVREPSLRLVPWRFAIEPGIGAVTATVRAFTIEGEDTLVAREDTRGGQTISGAWLTTYPGVVIFRLLLNGEPYGEPLRVIEGREF